MKKNKSIRTLALLALALVCARKGDLPAIEIPLESFGKGTKIAYVNMHKIFESFPETEKARFELNQLIEEKKANISARKEEIAQLRAQIDFLRRRNQAVDPQASERPRPTERPGSGEIETSTAAAEELTSLALPEGSPLEFLFSPPAESTAPRSGEYDTAEGRQNDSTRISTSGPEIMPGIPSVQPRLADKEADLSQKEADLAAFIGASEEEIKNLEEGKTMTLMARIYKSLEEIAAKDGYTIIVDKQHILYGENTVDITQTVIWRLSGPKSKGL